MEQTYEQWMARVNFALRRKVGLDMDDLPDYDTRSLYDDEVSVADAVYEILEAAGYEEE